MEESLKYSAIFLKPSLFPVKRVIIEYCVLGLRAQEKSKCYPTEKRSTVMNREFSMLHTLQSARNSTLEKIARLCAERMLSMTLEDEILAFIEQYFSIKKATGKAAEICNG